MLQSYLMHASLALGLILGAAGCNASFRPASHLQNLGFPAYDSKNEPAQKLNLALMRIWGIRNITIGSLVSLIWWYGDAKLMAMALSATVPIPIVDGFVSRGLTGGGEAQHWSVPPVMIAVIAGLYKIL